METWMNTSTIGLPVFGRTLSPDNEGMETVNRHCLGVEAALGRTLSPDNEGMETVFRRALDQAAHIRRTLSPDNEGMETRVLRARGLLLHVAGHSAPTMRGWKPAGGLRRNSAPCRPDTQPRQ